MIFADLHIHGRFSRATSKDLNLGNLEKYARLKGISLLGTGDIQHPKWNSECREQVASEKDGIFYTASGFPFLLTTELSLMYTRAEKGRRVHLHLLLPSWKAVEKLSSYLERNGRLDYDGRPIFKIDCEKFTNDVKEISNDIEVIPAHIWTPWFSLFGSKSGFNTVEECFGSASKHIHALETGLSSDPAMNWRLSALDKYTLVSNSDLHSFWPWRIGREATIFDCGLNYADIIKALRTRRGYVGTIEVDPNYGKYHYDGHRACGVCLMPKQSLKNNNICPNCRKPLTIGVLQRVEQLADRPEGFVPCNAGRHYKLIPLSEIICAVRGSSVSSKETWKTYHEVLKSGNDELDVLLNVPLEKLHCEIEIAEAVIKSRDGRIKVRPGYDGEYGVPLLGKTQLVPSKVKGSQKSLGDF